MSECRSCPAEVEWAMTAKGRRVPLDVDPVDPTVHGALLLHAQPPYPSVTGGPGTPRAPLALSLAQTVAQFVGEGLSQGAAETRALALPARISHFATCPGARTHRRRR